MPSLADTTAMLKRARLVAPGTARRGPDRPRRMVETTDFGANPGGLRMLSYTPEGLPSDAPLVVVLHGCTQGAEAFAQGSGWLTLADRFGFAVAAPEQVSGNNPNRCFNWFSPSDITRGGGEAASIAAMTAHATARFETDADRVFVSGLSAGGAMAAVMLATYPDVFAGGAIIAGLPYGVATSVGEALQVMRRSDHRDAAALAALVRGAAPQGHRTPRVSIWQGATDSTVSPANAEALVRQWAGTLGLATEPDELLSLTGRSHAIWRSPQNGVVLLERHLIDDLGHGTPLATGGPEGVGATAPYMLEAGVSAALESLRFWGLAPDAAKSGSNATAAPTPPTPEAEHNAVGEMVMRSVSGHASASVQAVIAKALRAAGLLR